MKLDLYYDKDGKNPVVKVEDLRAFLGNDLAYIEHILDVRIRGKQLEMKNKITNTTLKKAYREHITHEKRIHKKVDELLVLLGQEDKSYPHSSTHHRFKAGESSPKSKDGEEK